MRVIAAVTLLFLPGTFVATLFSASFWDFIPGNQGFKVSSYIWLYWLVTASVTAAVLFIWRGFPPDQAVRAVRRCSATGE
jgi:hypothetical protein